jgi:hypothetical protein
MVADKPYCSQSDHIKGVFLNITNHSARQKTTKINKHMDLILDR